jgi:hypothetical protein
MVSNCQESGCFVQRIRYQIPVSQIAALTSLSKQCEQHIRVSFFKNTETELKLKWRQKTIKSGAITQIAVYFWQSMGN